MRATGLQNIVSTNSERQSRVKAGLLDKDEINKIEQKGKSTALQA